ncbi:MAG TPA: G1 family glutamic endopeptidase [Gaiellaceae bacterium]|nr:G1 family glutamic endopeptidase [Gaiellaceae bacterium]
MRPFLGIAALVAALALAPATTATRLYNANSTSSNWAGFVASASGKAFTDVKGSWVQPAVTCAARSTGYASFWVGLGGASGSSHGLEQIGTSADCHNGVPSYTAWWEILPASSTVIPWSPTPGDAIAAEVRVSGTTVTMTLTDVTSGQTFTQNQTVSSPDTSSADWIAEAPQLCTKGCTTLPLSNFAPVAFSAASATLGSTTGPITAPGFGSYSLDLRPKVAGSASATTGPIGADGASFSVSSAAARTTVRKPAPKTPPRVLLRRTRHGRHR